MPCRDEWTRDATDPLETITVRATPAVPVRDYSLVVTVTDTTKSTAAVNMGPYSSFQLKGGATWPLRPGCVYHLFLTAMAEPGNAPVLDVSFFYNGNPECDQSYGRNGSGLVHQWTVVVV